MADSNRFHALGARSDLSVVDVAAALAGRPAVIGRIPAGRFPRRAHGAWQGTASGANQGGET